MVYYSLSFRQDGDGRRLSQNTHRHLSAATSMRRRKRPRGAWPGRGRAETARPPGFKTRSYSRTFGRRAAQFRPGTRAFCRTADSDEYDPQSAVQRQVAGVPRQRKPAPIDAVDGRGSHGTSIQVAAERRRERGANGPHHWLIFGKRRYPAQDRGASDRGRREQAKFRRGEPSPPPTSAVTTPADVPACTSGDA